MNLTITDMPTIWSTVLNADS